MMANPLDRRALAHVDRETSSDRMQRYLSSLTQAKSADQSQIRSDVSIASNRGTCPGSTSSTDLLDGRRAVEKRLRDRRHRRRRLARIRRGSPTAPQLNDSSTSTSSHLRKRRRLKTAKDKSRSPLVQDRSKSKASRLREESRRKHQRDRATTAKSAPHNIFGMLNISDRLLRPNRTRVTLPTHRSGIFSRTWPEDYGRARRDPHRRSYDRDSSSPSDSVGRSEMLVSRDRHELCDNDQVHRLQQQVKALERTVMDLRDSLVTAKNDRTTESLEAAPPPFKTVATESVQVDVSYMPWARAELNERPPSPPAVLAFDGDRPDTHRNGWRAQHILHEADAIQRQRDLVAAGGVRFRVDTPLPQEMASVTQSANEVAGQTQTVPRTELDELPLPLTPDLDYGGEFQDPSEHPFYETDYMLGETDSAQSVYNSHDDGKPQHLGLLTEDDVRGFWRSHRIL